ncbi:MAG TPA: endolytic transglycosylase MltG [Desulfuromonadaceae bacterium]
MSMFPLTFTPKTIVLSLVRASLLLLVGWYLFCLFVPPGSGSSVHDVSFPPGTGIRKLAQELKTAGVIRSSWHFILVARLRGQARRLKAGDYRLTDAMTPTRILRKLEAGDVDYRRFVLPEGYSIYQAAELLEQSGYFSKEAFLKACRDPALLARLHIQGESVEGYLFPATYNLALGSSEEQLIGQMVERFNRAYAGLTGGGEAGGRNRREIVTLASIIEKEAVTASEKPLIASVFCNRLRLGMPLQSDPTAVYGVRAFGGKVTRADIGRRSPYNTYLVTGLPPGPIGNPGSEALRAALHPASTNYLYFVARQDGTHQFSHTLNEHNRAVALYLKH